MPEPATPADDTAGTTPTATPAGAGRAAGRRSFGVTVLVGLGSGVLVAVGGNRAWADVGGDGTASSSIATVTASIEQATAPLVTSLALVVLAVWGVVLVSRGVFRRVVTWLGLLVAVLLLVAAAGAWVEAPRQVRQAIGQTDLGVHHTAWAYVSVAMGMVALVAAVGAVRGVRGWPEMGRRYDAPTGEAGAPAPVAPIEEQTNLDLWRAIDEGRDPTERS